MEDSFSICKQNVDACINTVIPIIDGFSLSIFRRKMEKVRPMGEEIDGKDVHFPPKSTL